MVRARLSFLKPMFSAVLALVLSVCALEVGLRVSDSYTRQFTNGDADEGEGLIRCRLTHHRLQPLESFVRRNPDTGATVNIRIHSFGLRGPEPVVPKPPGLYRILCLGDGTVFAPEVEESETFCSRLQELLQSRTRLQVEVVNAGVPAYSPLLSYLQVRHSLSVLQPDLLVLNFDMADVADDYRYRRHTVIDGSVPLACPHPDLEGPRTRPMDGPAHKLLLTKWGASRLSRLVAGQEHADDPTDISTPAGRYAWLKDEPPDWSIYLRQALSPIHELNRLADYLSARLVVVTYPAPWQVSPAASSGPEVRREAGVPLDAVYRSRAPFEYLAAYAESQNIAFCDTSPAFQSFERPEKLYLQNAPRFSRLGHELYARELAGFLLQTVPGIWSGGHARIHLEEVGVGPTGR